MTIYIAEFALGEDYVFSYASDSLERLLTFLREEKGRNMKEYFPGDKIGDWGESRIHQWLSDDVLWRVTECQSI